MNAHCKREYQYDDQEEIDEYSWSTSAKCVHDYDAWIEEGVVCQILIDSKRIEKAADCKTICIHLLNHYVLLVGYKFG